MDRGRLEYLRRQCADVPDQRVALDRRLAVGVRQAPESYRLPWFDVAPPRERGQLSAADVAWIERLPTDPSKVTDHDARELARLSLQVEGHVDGARLVASVFGPVRRLHEQRHAKAELEGVRVRDSALPNSAADAIAGPLADAIRADQPELTEGEATHRAREEVSTTVASLNREREGRRQQAEQALKSLGGDAA
jgi:hypothetical protein